MSIYEGRTSFSRILRGTAAPVRLEIFKDGTLIDVDAGADVRLTLTRTDGTALASDEIVTGHPSTGVYERLLTTTDTAQLDLLSATWSLVIDGAALSFTTGHEIVGGELFGQRELRRFGDGALADTVAYPDAAIAETRDRITDRFQDICGVSFVPRLASVTLDGSGRPQLWAPNRRIGAIRTATMDGRTVDSASIIPYPTGLLVLATGWSRGNMNIALAYEHGHQAAPSEIRRAAMVLARYELVTSDIADRALSYSNETGTFRLSFPDSGHWTGIPVVDEVLKRYDERALVA